MVNLVIVSHSYTLACGVAELAEQMNRGCQIAIAAGMEEPENAIGTDAVKIMSAIEQVYTPDGVVILMDLGSAILSAETALDLIDPDMAQHVKLCFAPLVEGALSAVVSASSGADLATIIAEAENALAAKKALGGEHNEPTAIATNALPSEKALRFSWIVQNPHGLHARPAAKLIETLSPFKSDVWIQKASEWINARSYNQLIQAQIRHQQHIHFYIEGEDAQQTLDALRLLAEGHFGEPIEANSLSGVPIISQKWEGQAVCLSSKFAKNEDNLTACKTLSEASSLTQKQLAELSHFPELPENFRELFQAHQLLLDDIVEEIGFDTPQEEVLARTKQVFETLVEQYQQLEDPYLQARALDIEDLRERFLRNVTGKEEPSSNDVAGKVVCIDELYPSRLLALISQQIAGVCISKGSPYSHTSLIAKSMNIPIIVQLGSQLNHIKTGDLLKIDWASGKISTT